MTSREMHLHGLRPLPGDVLNYPSDACVAAISLAAPRGKDDVATFS